LGIHKLIFISGDYVPILQFISMISVNRPGQGVARIRILGLRFDDFYLIELDMWPISIKIMEEIPGETAGTWRFWCAVDKSAVPGFE